MKKMKEDWKEMDSAPRNKYIIGLVDGKERVIRYGKTSHMNIYGFCIASQDPDDFDICNPTAWKELPKSLTHA